MARSLQEATVSEVIFDPKWPNEISEFAITLYAVEGIVAKATEDEADLSELDLAPGGDQNRVLLRILDLGAVSRVSGGVRGAGSLAVRNHLDRA